MAESMDSARRVRKRIMDGFVHDGHAPDAREIGRSLGMSRADVLAAFRELPKLDTFAIEPGTENVRILPPFSNLPTPYKVSVNGEQRWYAVCGPEALAVSLLFPGQRVQVDSYCRDCGETIRIVMQDETVLECEPAPLVVHLGVPVARWFEDLPYA